MTRNEYIADTAARLLASEEVGSVDSAIKYSVTLANSLESANVAPWPTPPAIYPLIERAHLFATFCAVSADVSANMKALAQAWLADYDAAKGGA